MLSYKEFIGLLQARRSIRRFESKPLPHGSVEQIIEAARWAPSGGDSEPWEFIVIRSRDLKDRIVELYKEAAEQTHLREQDNDPDLKRTYMVLPVPDPGFKDAPAFILVLGDPRTSIAFPLKVRETKAEEVLTSGLAGAFLCMHLAARSLGLGSQWVSGMSSSLIEEKLKELLGIPPGMMIYDMMAVGYPAYDPGPRSPRKLEEMVHYDGFQREKFRTKQDIKEFLKGRR
jgi:nitroreductase